MLYIIQIINNTIAFCLFGFCLAIWGSIYYYRTDSFFKQEFDDYTKQLKSELTEETSNLEKFILFMIPFSISIVFVLLHNPAMAGAMLFLTGTVSVFYTEVFDGEK